VTIDQLLVALAKRKVTLFLKEDSLRYRAPAGALTAELREAIGGHRPTLIDRLRHEQYGGQPDGPRECVSCDRTNWVDEPAKEGRIRTTCGKCGRFIGYRPENL